MDTVQGLLNSRLRVTPEQNTSDATEMEDLSGARPRALGGILKPQADTEQLEPAIPWEEPEPLKRHPPPQH